jgi:hypothetical protein
MKRFSKRREIRTQRCSVTSHKTGIANFKPLVYTVACVTSFHAYLAAGSEMNFACIRLSVWGLWNIRLDYLPSILHYGKARMQTLGAERQSICCAANASGTYYTVCTKHTCTYVLTLIYSFSDENYLLIFTNICKKLHSCMHMTGGKEILK